MRVILCFHISLPAAAIVIRPRYEDNQIEDVYYALEEMEHNLTAAVVSNQPEFLNAMLSRTVNGKPT